MSMKVFKFCFLLISCIDGRKYIIDTGGKTISIRYSTYFNKFHPEVEPRDMKVETEIARMVTNTSTSSGDYSSGNDDDCSLRLGCKAPKNLRIKSGSCSFT